MNFGDTISLGDVVAIMVAVSGLIIGLLAVVHGNLKKDIKNNEDAIDQMQKEFTDVHKEYATKEDIKEMKKDLKLLIKLSSGGGRNHAE